MSRADGDTAKADYLFDCGWFEYYYRIATFNRHQERVKKAMDEAKERSK